MTDNFVSPVSSRGPVSGPVEAVLPERTTPQAPANSHPTAGIEHKAEAEHKVETERKEELSTPVESKAPVAAFPDVRLRFNIDPHTHDVSVTMVDKGSGKIIRSIPAEELRNLDQGNLVELLA